MFKLLGVLLGFYVIYSLGTGSVFAKAGIWGRSFQRGESGWRYWSAVVVYALLALALFFYF